MWGSKVLYKYCCAGLEWIFVNYDYTRCTVNSPLCMKHWTLWLWNSSKGMNTFPRHSKQIPPKTIKINVQITYCLRQCSPFTLMQKSTHTCHCNLCLLIGFLYLPLPHPPLWLSVLVIRPFIEQFSSSNLAFHLKAKQGTASMNYWCLSIHSYELNPAQSCRGGGGGGASLSQ